MIDLEQRWEEIENDIIKAVTGLGHDVVGSLVETLN
jgi:hypothetical protein